MPFPKKEYLDFDELALRWNIPVRDVFYYAKHGYFQTVMWVNSFGIETHAECTIEEVCQNITTQGIKGYVIVAPDDVHRIVLDGVVKVRCFRSSDKNMICFIPPQLDPVPIKGEHLRININECARFEEEHEVKAVDRTSVPSVSYPGRTSIMHKILNKFDDRCRAGEIAPKLIEECRYLRQWIIETSPADQPPTENTIANALRQPYNKAQNMLALDKQV